MITPGQRAVLRPQSIGRGLARMAAIAALPCISILLQDVSKLGRAIVRAAYGPRGRPLAGASPRSDAERQVDNVVQGLVVRAEGLVSDKGLSCEVLFRFIVVFITNDQTLT